MLPPLSSSRRFPRHATSEYALISFAAGGFPLRAKIASSVPLGEGYRSSIRSIPPSRPDLPENSTIVRIARTSQDDGVPFQIRH